MAQEMVALLAPTDEDGDGINDDEDSCSEDVDGDGSAEDGEAKSRGGSEEAATSVAPGEETLPMKEIGGG